MAYSQIDLSGAWSLTSPLNGIAVPIALPGDVHSALLAAGVIPDPYFADNEERVMWVNQTPWRVERSFHASASDTAGHLTLTLAEIDCVACVRLNGEVVAETDNAFLRHDIDVTGKVREGENTLAIDFAVARDVAKARFAAHPFPIPYHAGNQKVGHLNFIRKAACHAGWDWGICLLPIGVYGCMSLRRSHRARQDSVQVEQVHKGDAVELTIRTRIHAFAEGAAALRHRIDGQEFGGEVALRPGENLFVHTVVIAEPKLWWPNGQGEQPLYELETDLDGETTTRRLGLRRLEWVVEADNIDHCFHVRVNGRDVFAFGANWIPNDALPSRITPAAVRDVLESAAAANMNMIRVWGGGQYEPDWFYRLCDELGLMVWQDFMFSCMPYPSNPAFLESVRTEITQQLRRLQHHASIALWCGDNECIGSLNWFPETRANRDRYVANYDRLNSMLGAIAAAEDPGRRFWPSSPSLGYMDFADGWHVDTRGDMHYWDVWHSAKPFEAYRDQHPRFASEFGFQSFPSMPVIESFAVPADRNPSSPVMETHQRNEGGNARILETMCRYFRFPKDFEAMVFLSQVQQGLAIKTAIEYWRSTKPRCMGTLFWQINDTWPVASWSSLNYGGSWKPLHHMAKRFFASVSVVAVPDGDAIALRGINDKPAGARIGLEVRAVNMEGRERVAWSGFAELPTETAVEIARIPAASLAPDEFLFFAWRDAEGQMLGENDFFPRAYKYYELPVAQVSAEWQMGGEAPVLTLSTDRPAFFVTATANLPGTFSDNAITLLPARPTALTFKPQQGASVTLQELQAGLQVRHLQETF